MPENYSENCWAHNRVTVSLSLTIAPCQSAPCHFVRAISSPIELSIWSFYLSNHADDTYKPMPIHEKSLHCQCVTNSNPCRITTLPMPSQPKSYAKSLRCQCQATAKSILHKRSNSTKCQNASQQRWGAYGRDLGWTIPGLPTHLPHLPHLCHLCHVCTPRVPQHCAGGSRHRTNCEVAWCHPEAY